VRFHRAVLDELDVAEVPYAPTMQCKNCGRLNPSGSLYCQDCGQRLGEWGANERPNALPTPPTGIARGNGGVAAAGFGGPAAMPQAYGVAHAAPAPSPAMSPAMNTCPRCSTQNPAHMRFCNNCGYQLGGSGVPAQQAPAPAAPVYAPQPAPQQARPAAGPPVCWRCRSAGDSGAEFCKFCGARYSDGGGQAAAPSAPSVGAAVAAYAFGPGNGAPLAPQQPAMHAPPAHAATAHAPPQAQAPMAQARGDRTQHEQAAPAADRGRVLAVLVAILKDGTDGRSHTIHDEQTDVGRTEGHIQLSDDPYLSPRHARLVLRKDELLVRDLDSLNGVYVRLRDGVELTDGDMLLLGQQVMRFEILPETELPLGPATQRGVLVFGTPEVARVARLVQYTTEGVARDVHYLYRDETVVGREQGDIVCTDDPFMSRRHATITLERAARRFTLRDLGSSNGTAIRVRGERVLKPGDQFRVGRHLFRYDRPGERAAA
jgi:pSer/pThr/pTyr-binding forkhead associated (FHA) protein